MANIKIIVNYQRSNRTERLFISDFRIITTQKILKYEFTHSSKPIDFLFVWFKYVTLKYRVVLNIFRINKTRRYSIVFAIET